MCLSRTNQEIEPFEEKWKELYMFSDGETPPTEVEIIELFKYLKRC